MNCPYVNSLVASFDLLSVSLEVEGRNNFYLLLFFPFVLLGVKSGDFIAAKSKYLNSDKNKSIIIKQY